MKNGVLSRNSGSRHTIRSIKGTKDADDRLVSVNILSQKNGPLEWRPRPGKFGQRCKNKPALWRHQQKNPNPNEI